MGSFMITQLSKANMNRSKVRYKIEKNTQKKLRRFKHEYYFDKFTSQLNYQSCVSRGGFWSAMKPFMTNKCILTIGNITIRYKSRLLTGNSKI